MQRFNFTTFLPSDVVFELLNLTWLRVVEIVLKTKVVFRLPYLMGKDVEEILKCLLSNCISFFETFQFCYIAHYVIVLFIIWGFPFLFLFLISFGFLYIFSHMPIWQRFPHIHGITFSGNKLLFMPLAAV